MNVLVVDDNSTNRKLLLATLGAEKLTVFEAADGVEALAVLEREKIDAIISDILMPRMDGYRLCYAVRRDERFRGISFIVYTSTYTSPGDEKFSLELGADKFVRKPASAGEMVKLLRELSPRPHAKPRVPPEELTVLKEYSERLVAKLEEKNAVLIRTLEELRRARDFHLTLLDDFPTPVWRSSVDGKCNYFNHTWLQFTGRKLEEELGDGWMRGVHAEDVERVVKDYLEAFHARRPFELQYRLRRFDGVYRDVTDHGRPYRGSDGKFAGYIGSCYDITELKRAQQDQARLAAIVDSAEEAIIAKSLEGVVISWNAAAERVYGYSAKEMLGKSITLLIPPDRLPEWEQVQARVQKGEHVPPFETLRIRKNGARIDVSVSLSPLRDSVGRVIGVSAIARDISARKRVETALRESEEKFSKTFHSNPAMLVISTPDGKTVDMNQAYVDFVGYTRSEILGKSAVDLQIISLEERRRILQLTEGYCPVRNAEITVHLRNGRFRHILYSVEMISLGGVPHRSSTLLDITERKLAEEELRKSREQLRALAARLQAAREEEGLRIARAIHDELGHALTSLGIDLVNLEQSLSKDPLPLSKILQRTNAMAQLVAETGRTVQRIAMDLRPSLLDDLGLAAALEWQTDEFAARTGLGCRWRHKPDDCGLPNEQAIVVFRIFQEILTNIARHACATKVDMSCARKGGSLVLSISDDGKGFDEKNLSSRPSLGLLGMRERALLIGGEVEIQSAPGEGTTVTLTVPVRTEPDKTAKAAAAARRKKT